VRNPSFPEISCIICSEPLDLSLDLSADEYGKAVHTECYVKHITSLGVQEYFFSPAIQSPSIFGRNAVLEALRFGLFSATAYL